MANDTFTLRGSLKISLAPTVTPPGIPSINVDILEQLALKAKAISYITLAVDGAEVVNFADLASAHAIALKSDLKCIARFTSADGAAQAIPVDTFACVMSSSVPFTALSLERVSGVLTKVSVVLAEKA